MRLSHKRKVRSKKSTWQHRKPKIKKTTLFIMDEMSTYFNHVGEK